MVEVVAIVEGETEQTFVRNQLAGHLGNRDIAIWPVLPGRTRRHGGVREWQVSSADMIRTLKEGRYCTTMFDYYAMPASWPGRTSSALLPWHQRARHVEEAIISDIGTQLGDPFAARRLIPYVQLHEFEALIFSSPADLAAVGAALADVDPARLQAKFEQILASAGSPEAINDGYETCPSRRISGLVRSYRKPVHGPIITSRIGLEHLRQKCVHFGSWLARLELLQALS